MPSDLRRWARENLAPVLEERGFTRHGDLWLWSVSRLAYVVGLSNDAAARRLIFGVWVPELAAMLNDDSSPQLRDAAMCHIRLDEDKLDSSLPLPDAETIGGRLARLERIETLADVSRFIDSDEPRAWPVAAAICELYQAGIAALTGSPAVYALAEAAAAHLAGAGEWSEQANRVYRAVATLE